MEGYAVCRLCLSYVRHFLQSRDIFMTKTDTFFGKKGCFCCFENIYGAFLESEDILSSP